MQSSLAALAEKKGEKRSLDEENNFEGELRLKTQKISEKSALPYADEAKKIMRYLNSDEFKEEEIRILLETHDAGLAAGLMTLAWGNLYTKERQDLLAAHPKYARELAGMYIALQKNPRILEENFADLISDPPNAEKVASLLCLIDKFRVYKEYRDFVIKHRQWLGLYEALEAFLKAKCLKENLLFIEQHLSDLGKLSIGFTLLYYLNLATPTNLLNIFNLIELVPTVVNEIFRDKDGIETQNISFLVSIVMLKLEQARPNLLTQSNLDLLFKYKDYAERTLLAIYNCPLTTESLQAIFMQNEIEDLSKSAAEKANTVARTMATLEEEKGSHTKVTTTVVVEAASEVVPKTKVTAIGRSTNLEITTKHHGVFNPRGKEAVIHVFRGPGFTA